MNLINTGEKKAKRQNMTLQHYREQELKQEHIKLKKNKQTVSSENNTREDSTIKTKRGRLGQREN